MTTTLHRLIATAIGAGAVAVGTLAMSAPAGADTIQASCEQGPGAYADGAVLGVYSISRYGYDRYQNCDTYDAAHRHLGTFSKPDYGFYRRLNQSVPQNAQIAVR